MYVCIYIQVACASSNNQDALNLLFPLLKDRVDLVRQSAYIALSMVYIYIYHVLTHTNTH